MIIRNDPLCSASVPSVTNIAVFIWRDNFGNLHRLKYTYICLMVDDFVTIQVARNNVYIARKHCYKNIASGKEN